MLLENLNIIGQTGIKHIRVLKGKISEIVPDRALLSGEPGELSLAFEKAIAFPGLINSHDHLDFNLFPQFKNRIYKNYKEWGSDIQLTNKSTIDHILSIPKELRVQWGIYKNLFNGITTVVNHGKFINIKEPLINIFQDCYSLHSVEEKLWQLKLNRPFMKDQAFVIHAGEGTDSSSSAEINRLIKWNIFKRRIIAIHGVAMNKDQARSFEALVWCPDSNYFLLDATAHVDELKKKTNILFGTDSTLTATWNIWEHLRLARKTGMLTDEELFHSVTSVPAAVWGLDAKGGLESGQDADMVIAMAHDGSNSMNNFFKLNPENILMVLRGGKIILFDSALHSFLATKIEIANFSEVGISHTRKYVYGNLTGLMEQTKKYVPGMKLFFQL